jgi:hypothetical protein
MKINNKTLNILKNFATINPSIIVKPGNTLKTISSSKTILARAEVPDTFEYPFAIYNLSQFIGCISMFTDPDFDFDESSVTISDGKNKIVYHYADSSIILAPPDKDINIPSVDAEFKISATDIPSVAKALSILELTEIAIIGDGENIFIQAIDSKNASSNQYSVKVGATDKVFKAIFKPDNLKMIPDDYIVTLSSKGLSKFAGTDATYYVAIEATSTF